MLEIVKINILNILKKSTKTESNNLKPSEEFHSHLESAEIY